MIHRLHHGVLYLEVPGDIVSTGVRELSDQLGAVRALAEVKGAAWHTMELDLTHARMIDSMGLNFVVQMLKWVKEREAKTRILIRDNNLDRLLRFTRLNEHAEIIQA
jgi:anti-anti-sigma regulatory factor